MVGGDCARWAWRWEPPAGSAEPFCGVSAAGCSSSQGGGELAATSGSGVPGLGPGAGVIPHATSCGSGAGVCPHPASIIGSTTPSPAPDSAIRFSGTGVTQQAASAVSRASVPHPASLASGGGAVAHDASAVGAGLVAHDASAVLGAGVPQAVVVIAGGATVDTAASARRAASVLVPASAMGNRLPPQAASHTAGAGGVPQAASCTAGGGTVEVAASTASGAGGPSAWTDASELSAGGADAWTPASSVHTASRSASFASAACRRPRSFLARAFALRSLFLRSMALAAVRLSCSSMLRACLAAALAIIRARVLARLGSGSRPPGVTPHAASTVSTMLSTSCRGVLAGGGVGVPPPAASGLAGIAAVSPSGSSSDPPSLSDAPDGLPPAAVTSASLVATRSWSRCAWASRAADMLTGVLLGGLRLHGDSDGAEDGGGTSGPPCAGRRVSSGAGAGSALGDCAPPGPPAATASAAATGSASAPGQGDWLTSARVPWAGPPGELSGRGSSPSGVSLGAHDPPVVNGDGVSHEGVGAPTEGVKSTESTKRTLFFSLVAGSRDALLSSASLNAHERSAGVDSTSASTGGGLAEGGSVARSTGTPSGVEGS
mmetsp:Transcript_41872/g.99326  ORF Transcript_41872/g.99326 Transcript_41872/m.99326 type:complete len:604 (-) Transcript_41872:681-2492(-)